MNCIKCKKDLPEGSLFCCWCGRSQKPKKDHGKSRGNGEGTVYKLPNGKYMAEVTLGFYIGEDGKQKRRSRKKTFVKKVDAINALPSLRIEVEKPKDLTLHELYDIYTSTKDYDALSKSQCDKLKYAWNRLKPLEFRGITTLTVADMEGTIYGATETYYPARDMKVLLSHLYKAAIKREIVPFNKSDYIELPDAPKAKRECWTQDEVQAMWEDYKEHPFTGYILIMCYAGLRYGELASMPLENIHLDKSYMIGGIKTDAGINREIPIHDRIKPLIESLSASRKSKLLEMNEDNFYTAYWEMISRTGIRELPPHTCRHWYFTRLTSEGVQAGIIAETGGHVSYLTTMRNYVRIPLEDKIKAVNRV